MFTPKKTKSKYKANMYMGNPFQDSYLKNTIANILLLMTRTATEWKPQNV